MTLRVAHQNTNLHDVNEGVQADSIDCPVIAYAKGRRTIRARILHTAKRFGVTAVADAFGVHYSHVYNMVKRGRGVSPTLETAMKERGLWYAPCKRKRAAVWMPSDFTDEQVIEFRRRLRECAARVEMEMRGE